MLVLRYESETGRGRNKNTNPMITNTPVPEKSICVHALNSEYKTYTKRWKLNYDRFFSPSSESCVCVFCDFLAKKYPLNRNWSTRVQYQILQHFCSKSLVGKNLVLQPRIYWVQNGESQQFCKTLQNIHWTVYGTYCYSPADIFAKTFQLLLPRRKLVAQIYLLLSHRSLQYLLEKGARKSKQWIFAGLAIIVSLAVQ